MEVIHDIRTLDVSVLGACSAYILLFKTLTFLIFSSHRLICQALVHVTRDLRTLRQQLYRQRRSSRPDSISAYQISVAVAVYIFSGHSAPVAAEYCEQQTSRTTSLSDWANAVQNWYLSYSIEQLVDFHQADKPSIVRVAGVARKWLARRGIAFWVRIQNYQFGVAPSSGAMVQKFAELTQDVRIAGTVAIIGRAGRRFRPALRKRWGIRLGALKLRDEMPDHTIREKAQHGKTKGDAKARESMRKHGTSL
jgi:hypothetical protein